jgi:hypothetical protein
MVTGQVEEIKQNVNPYMFIYVIFVIFYNLFDVDFVFSFNTAPTAAP